MLISASKAISDTTESTKPETNHNEPTENRKNMELPWAPGHLGTQVFQETKKKIKKLRKHHDGKKN